MSLQVSRKKKKEHELRVRMTDVEWTKLKEAADNRSMSISEFVRYLARQVWDKPRES